MFSLLAILFQMFGLMAASHNPDSCAGVHTLDVQQGTDTP